MSTQHGRQMKMQIQKIISGGQTGADQAALDTAIACGFSHGGALPAGRKTEAGRLPDRYQMEELETERYQVRTEKNVRDSDGTLIVSHGKLSGGSALTYTLASKLLKPCIHIDLLKISPSDAVSLLNEWLTVHQIRVLNVAGPRASCDPKIYENTMLLLTSLLTGFKGEGHEAA